MRAPAPPRATTPLPFDVETAATRIAVPPEAIRRVLEMTEDERVTAERSTGVVPTPPCSLTARELEGLGRLWEHGSGGLRPRR